MDSGRGRGSVFLAWDLGVGAGGVPLRLALLGRRERDDEGRRLDEEDDNSGVRSLR